MNKKDFERLKAVCEKEGFELLKSLPDKDTNFHILAVSKKDIWDGVEFVKYVSSETGTHIKKVTGQNDDQIIFEKGWVYKCASEPSTESAYIEQLKKEAFERFREIRNGDTFKQPWFHSPITIQGENKGFTYKSFQDSLFFNGWAIYHSGKWATRMKERVEVKCIDYDYEQGNYYADKFALRFESKNLVERDYDKVGQFLASQLEKYLNGEVE